MKIGFFTDTYLPEVNGVATSVESAAKALQKHGHEVYIVAPKHPRYRDKSNNVYRLTSMKILNSPEIRFALQLPEKPLLQILKIDFDIIHAHAGGPVCFLGWEIARARNIPYLLTYHTFLNRYTHYFFNGKFMSPRAAEILTRVIGNLCDRLIAPTEKVKKELTLYGVKKPIAILSSGINIDHYHGVQKGFLRKKLHLSDDTRILLSVGRLGKEKSVDFLIKSFALVHKQYKKAVLVLVGSGAEEKNLKKLAKELHVDKHVYFFGSVRHADIPKVYADANLFVFASDTETQGMVILEALASNLPVIAIKSEAYKGILTNNRNGFLLGKDTKEFAEKVLTLLQDNELYDKFFQATRQTVKQFSVDTGVDKLEKLYKKAIKEKGEKNRILSVGIENLQRLRSLFIKIKEQLKEIQ